VQDKLFRKVALERLSSPEQLDQLMQVTGPKSWLALAALFALLVVVVVWGIFGSIAITVEGTGVLHTDGGSSPLEAVIYVPLAQAQKIHLGNDVLLLPSSVRQEEHGYLIGVVRSVSTTPATVADKVRVFGSEDLANALAPQTLTIEVVIDLHRNDNGDYQWTSTTGPNIALESGLPIWANIETARVRPISRILPSTGSLPLLSRLKGVGDD
jgi:hypothetical protein